MHLDQVITVFCTDHETQKKGKIIRIYSSGIDVEVSGTIIKLKKTKPNFYIGSMAGLEFVVKTKNLYLRRDFNNFFFFFLNLFHPVNVY